MSELNQLIENSRINESIAEKLFEIETQVLACQSSHQLLELLLTSIKDKFNLTGISLLMVEPTPISYLLNGNIQSPWHQQNTRAISSDKLTKLHPDNKPLLSNQVSDFANTLPKSLLAQAKSLALTPLKLENKLFASLLFTDSDPSRFHPELGTYHLEQLAVKVSLCLSNVLIREQLEHMAHYDRLTGVANRRLMEDCIAQELIRQKRYGVPFSVIFIDCNKFKQINDTYGHDCGDKVLTYVATSLKELIRENDQCFRYAGDEFVITLASQTYGEAVLAAKRLSDFFINNPMPYQGKQLPISISCGVAASNGQQNMDELLKAADTQLYQQKSLCSAGK
ncbi:sensor domain-containing diguanylate cyclase [Thalassotalea sp. PLHSN55]|uniref:sensor domain-containing diguanylate cyclase n=1 Tax=Thalassotalea sp. PLHSN55 TaxID=3435888 RepID=UPI003F837382